MSKKKYVRVKPSREELNADDIVGNLSSLHKLEHSSNNASSGRSLLNTINPLHSDSDVPKFEFLIVSEGLDKPINFYYRTHENLLNTLRRRLLTSYPSSFDIDIVEVDLRSKLNTPEKFQPDDFVKKLEDGELQYSAEVAGTEDDLTATEASQSDESTDADTTDDLGLSIDNDDAIPMSLTETEKQSFRNPPTAESSERVYNDRVGDDQSSPEAVDEDLFEDAAPLAVLDDSVLKDIDPPSAIDSDTSQLTLDNPTQTEDGTILAHPTLENGTPIAARWYGEADRKKDWMTTLKMFSRLTEPDADGLKSRAPLASLIQSIAETDFPIAFQVVFQTKPDWSDKAQRRKRDLHLDRDTLSQKIRYDLGELVHGSSAERREEKRRDYFSDMGEDARNDESMASGDVGKRAALLDSKVPKRTFNMNMRAVAVATDSIPTSDVKTAMEDISSALDHLDGYYYGLTSDIVEDKEGFIGSEAKATETLQQILNRSIATGSGKKRPDIVVNTDELANFVAVPSSENLTTEGTRGTRADPESRSPLPRPDPDLMEEFHQPGMRVGYSLDEKADAEPVPTQIPPKLLNTHYGRFATTGAGKSKALINDILSLYENTDGPVILVDPKGDGMPENYMRSHYARFGEEDLQENVIHFPVPDILPGFTFFNINPALNQEARRSDAIKDKADHYEELLKLVMGAERYRESKVAPTIISALIKSLFDKQHAPKRDGRDTANKFSHRDLEEAATEMRKAVGNDDESVGNIPTVSDDRVQETLTRHKDSTDQDFSTIMTAVFNRLDYIREDVHLRKIFDNTEKKFDFRDHLNDDKVIIFDLGELREEATVIMTGLIMMNLWDATTEHHQTNCTEGHADLEECRNAYGRPNAKASRLPCRTEWDDDHLANLIIDEAASVAVSDIMNKMLEQGRGFNLSIGLSMQFPEQMMDAGERVYKNVLNNIGSFLVGKITLDEEIASAMAHENMSPEEFDNRIKSMPRGEWIGQFPSPQFQRTGPEPFSLQPLPIPHGHPESEHPFTRHDEESFVHILDNVIKARTEQQYGIEQTDDAMASFEPKAGSEPNDQRQNSNTQNNASGRSDKAQQANATESTRPSDDSATQTDTQENGLAPPPVSADDSVRIKARKPTADTDSNGREVGGGPSEAAQSTSQAAATDTVPNESSALPNHIQKTGGGYKCNSCGSTYLTQEVDHARSCCTDASGRDSSNPYGSASANGTADALTNGHSTESSGTNLDRAAGLSPSTEHDAPQNGHEDSAGTTTNGAHTAVPGADPAADTTQNTTGSSDAHAPADDESALDTSQGSPDATETRYSRHDDGESGLPTHPIGESDLNGDEGSYDPSHVHEHVPITSVDDFSAVLNTWNRSSVLALATTVLEAFIALDETMPSYLQVPPELRNTCRQMLIDAACDHDVCHSVSKEQVYTLKTRPFCEESIDAALAQSFMPLPNRVDVYAIWCDLADRTDSFPHPDDEPFDDISIPGRDTDQWVHPEVSETGPTPPVAIEPHQRGRNVESLPLSDWELDYLATLVAIFNNDRQLARDESLLPVTEHFEEVATADGRQFDHDRLVDNGYLQEHIVNRIKTYTPTPKGRDMCGVPLRKGAGCGDIGDKMPHRFGADITRQWLDKHVDTVDRVETFRRIDDPVLNDAIDSAATDDVADNYMDLLGISDAGDSATIETVVEVEAGRSKREADAADSDTARAGINDKDSLQKDYDLMARGSDEIRTPSVDFLVFRFVPPPGTMKRFQSCGSHRIIERMLRTTKVSEVSCVRFLSLCLRIFHPTCPGSIAACDKGRTPGVPMSVCESDLITPLRAESIGLATATGVANCPCLGLVEASAGILPVFVSIVTSRTSRESAA